MKPVPKASDGPWNQSLARRDVLRLGAFLAAGGALGPLVSACSTTSRTGAPAVAPGAGSGTTGVPGPITVLMPAADAAEPTLMKVYDDFKAQTPGLEWDIRALPGGGPEWDRLARASITSGEAVGLVVINGQQVRGWVRDGLLANLDAIPAMAEVLASIPEQYHLSGAGELVTRALPLALTRGVQTTGLFYNKALLDQVGLGPPTTVADLKAMVKPLSALDVAPLVHCSGDVFFNQILVTWLLPMIFERGGEPLALAESTVRGDVRYDSPEWIETFETIADLRASGVLLEGSGAVDYATMQRLFLQGKAATTFNGSWLLPQLLAASPTVPFDLHIAPPPLVAGASRPRPILAWTGIGLPAEEERSRDSVYAFLEYASRPEVDAAIARDIQCYSPIETSNVGLENEVSREFLPMLDDAITPIDWLWEPEITVEIDNQVQALVKGDTDPPSVGAALQATAELLRSSGRGYYP